MTKKLTKQLLVNLIQEELKSLKLEGSRNQKRLDTLVQLVTSGMGLNEEVLSRITITENDLSIKFQKGSYRFFVESDGRICEEWHDERFGYQPEMNCYYRTPEAAAQAICYHVKNFDNSMTLKDYLPDIG